MSHTHYLLENCIANIFICQPLFTSRVSEKGHLLGNSGLPVCGYLETHIYTPSYEVVNVSSGRGFCTMGRVGYLYTPYVGVKLKTYLR
jgi:hypothetical protein